MAIIGEWIRRLGYLLRRGAREDELRREMEAHRVAQAKGRHGVFRDYRLRVAEVMRDYGMHDRHQAPQRAPSPCSGQVTLDTPIGAQAASTSTTAGGRWPMAACQRRWL